MEEREGKINGFFWLTLLCGDSNGNTPALSQAKQTLLETRPSKTVGSYLSFTHL